MASSKLRKISKIVKEISVIKGTARYDIAGLQLPLCKFFYREPQKQFKDLSLGDYTIDTSSNTQVLVIQNSEILNKAESIQVCYELDLTSSKYETDFEVDINRLLSSYNEAVEDLHELWAYIKTVGMISDDTTIDLILPQLDTNEVWVKTEDGYKGVSLVDVEQSIKDTIDKYSQQKIEQIKQQLDHYTQNTLKPMLDDYKEDKKLELNLHTDEKKEELNRHEDLKEQELNDLKEQLAREIQDLVNGAIADKGAMPVGADWHTLDRGSYYVTDLFNSNYKNHPYKLANPNEGQGIVIVGIADGGKTKVIRYYSTSKRMFFQILTQSHLWSEWAVMGGGQGTVYEVSQPGHGFNFNAIMLDGDTNRWVLADKNIGADAVAVKIDNDRFQLLLSGQAIVLTSARDDKGNQFISDEYYFLSNKTDGGLQKDKPKYGLFQSLFHTRIVDNKLVADVEIGDVHDLTQHIVDNETLKDFGILTNKIIDPYHAEFAYDTIIKHLNKIEVTHNFTNSNPKLNLQMYNTCCDKIGDEFKHRTLMVMYDRGESPQLSQFIIKEEKTNQSGSIFVVHTINNSSPELSR